VQLQVVENIAEGESSGWFGESQIPNVYGKGRPYIIIFACMSAEMECLVMTDSHGFENIQRIIEDIGYIPVIECVAEFKSTLFKNKNIEELPLHMNMYVFTADAFTEMR
jgi:hypothetical protein